MANFVWRMTGLDGDCTAMVVTVCHTLMLDERDYRATPARQLKFILYCVGRNETPLAAVHRPLLS